MKHNFDQFEACPKFEEVCKLVQLILGVSVVPVMVNCLQLLSVVCSCYRRLVSVGSYVVFPCRCTRDQSFL